MSAFDAGALVFKLQTLGAQAWKQDQADAKQAIEKTGQAASKAATDVDKLGKSSDETGKKSKKLSDDIHELEKQVKAEALASETAAQKLARLKQEQSEAAAAAKEMSQALLLAGAAAAAMVTLAVVKHTEFDAAMSNTRAATMATAEEQRALGDAALQAGADTAYSASEAAAAEEELAKAGQSVADIVGGSLNASLGLAAAGQLQVARSAEIMATAMTQFEIPAERAGKVADVLAAGAGKAQGSVDDLALALSYVGPLANQAGWSLEETSGALAYFASQGILGEKAGTSLRGVLAALQAPSSVAAKTMEQYGLSIYDANGNMLSASQIAGNLQKAFGHLTQAERNAAMGRIFGNESLVAANLLYDGGAAKVQEWTTAVDDAGFAAEQAAMRQDNLAGDLEKLGGAFDTALIKSGSAANDVLRGMVQSTTFLIDLYGEAPAPIQQTAMVLGVATAAMLLFGGAAVGVRVKYVELKAALDATNTSMSKTAVAGGLAGLALTGVLTIIGLLIAKQADAQRRTEAYADTLEDGTLRVTRATRDMVRENLAASNSFLWIENASILDKADALGISLGTVQDAAMGNADALRELAAAEREYAAAATEADRRGDNTSEHHVRLQQIQQIIAAVKGEHESIEAAISAEEQKQRAAEESAESSQTAAEAFIAEAESAEELEGSLSDLVDTMNRLNDIGQDANSANIDYQNTLRDVDEQIKNIRDGVEGFGRGIDATTQAGADNRDMLIGLAEDSQQAAQAQLDLDGNTQTYISSLQEGRQRLIDSAIAMGASKDAAHALADQIYKIPTQKEIDLIADTETAEARLARVKKAVERIPGFRRITLETVTYGNRTVSDAGHNGYADGAVVSFHANGSVSENHVAQIARAGEMRVWAEPETGGETYVPHALSKRPRAEAIMAMTADIFGGVYIPGSAARFAEGSEVTGGWAGGGGLGALIAEVRALRDALGRPNVSFVNPVSRDAKSDAWEAAQIVGV